MSLIYICFTRNEYAFEKRKNRQKLSFHLQGKTKSIFSGKKNLPLIYTNQF